MPYQLTSWMIQQIIASNHNFTLFKVFTNGKGKKILIDLTLFIQLLYKQRCSCSSCNRCKAYNAITGHSRKTLLVDCCNKRHLIDTLSSSISKAYLVCWSISPNSSGSVANLCYFLTSVCESNWLFVSKIICCGTCLALWSLYPEPRRPCIENELMRFLSTAKEYSRENLNVKEVRKIFL